MKRFASSPFGAALTAIFVLAGACAKSGPAEQARNADELARIFDEYMETEKVPGIALVALKGNKTIERRGFGVSGGPGDAPMRTDQAQPIYSVSKQFAAVLILRLAEEGLIDLDDPVGEYLPDFGDQAALTIRTLLLHDSGIPDFIVLPEILATDHAPRGTGSLAETVANIAKLPRRFAPGARHSYSNSNYTILARIAEIVTGEAYDDALTHLVLAPAAIDGIIPCDRADRAALTTGHDASGAVVELPPNLVPNYSGNGGLCATAEALAQWTRALGAGRILPPDQLAEMLRADKVAAGYTPPYGFAVSVRPVAGIAAISHSGVGDGWGAWAAYFPDEELTIVILANRGGFWPTDLGAPTVRHLTGAAPRSPLDRLALKPAEQSALTGFFEDGLFDITLNAEADRITLDNPAFGEPIEFWKQADGAFVSPARPDTFSMRLVNGRPEIDWIESRSYFERHGD